MPPARLPCCLSISFSLVFGVNTLAGFSLSCVICRKNGSLILASGCTRELFCKVRSCFFSDSYVPALGLFLTISNAQLGPGFSMAPRHILVGPRDTYGSFHFEKYRQNANSVRRLMIFNATLRRSEESLLAVRVCGHGCNLLLTRKRQVWNEKGPANTSRLAWARKRAGAA